jgi:AraC-like DNA-binding protein
MKDSSAMGEYRSATMACEILSLAAWGRRCEPSVNRLQQLVDACLRTIQDRYTWPDLTVDWLARTLKVHRSVLSRAFSKSVGVPISRYIQSMRIRRALSLLNDATQTIAEVAHASGFADPAYFSRCLSKEMGCSPRKIRKSLS